MIFQRVNRTDPEKVFVVVYNSYSTAAITVGQVVNWDFGTDIDGVGVTRPTARATNAGLAVAGAVASASIAAGSYGLVQVYGYHSDCCGSPAGVASGRFSILCRVGVHCEQRHYCVSVCVLV
jgi:hypothetical protein